LTYSDKLPPSATCPTEDVGLVAEHRLVEVDFPEPTFKSEHEVAKNHKSGIYESTWCFIHVGHN